MDKTTYGKDVRGEPQTKKAAFRRGEGRGVLRTRPVRGGYAEGQAHMAELRLPLGRPLRHGGVRDRPGNGRRDIRVVREEVP